MEDHSAPIPGETTSELRGMRKSSQVPSLLAERAQSECARSMRAFEDQPARFLKRKQASLEGTLMAVFLKYEDSEGPRWTRTAGDQRNTRHLSSVDLFAISA